MRVRNLKWCFHENCGDNSRISFFCLEENILLQISWSFFFIFESMNIFLEGKGMLPEKVHGTVGNHRQGEPQFLIEQAQEKGIRLIPTSYSTNWRINTMKPSFFCSAPLSASSAIPFVISNGVMFVRLTSASKAQAFFFFFFCVHVLLLFGLYALRVLHYSTILFSIMG